MVLELDPSTTERVEGPVPCQNLRYRAPRSRRRRTKIKSVERDLGEAFRCAANKRISPAVQTLYVERDEESYEDSRRLPWYSTEFERARGLIGKVLVTTPEFQVVNNRPVDVGTGILGPDEDGALRRF